MSETELEYLTFMLDGEEFGIDILRVQEIRVWSPVTELPNTPSYLKGVINLRGTIVPIVDLRERFGCESLAYSDTTVTIILRTETTAKQVVVGIVVDAVSEVYKFTAKNIRPAPDLGTNIDINCMKGMAAVNDKLIILLNTEKLLDVNELYQVSNSVCTAS